MPLPVYSPFFSVPAQVKCKRIFATSVFKDHYKANHLPLPERTCTNAQARIQSGLLPMDLEKVYGVEIFLSLLLVNRTLRGRGRRLGPSEAFCLLFLFFYRTCESALPITTSFQKGRRHGIGKAPMSCPFVAIDDKSQVQGGIG